MALLMDYLQDDEKQLIAQISDAESPITVLDLAFQAAERKFLMPRYGSGLLFGHDHEPMRAM